MLLRRGREARGCERASHRLCALKKIDMIDSCGNHGVPVRSARGQLCPSSMSAPKMDISTAVHGAQRRSLMCRAADLLLAGRLDRGGLPGLGFPSGHALPQPLWVRGQVVDQLSANLIRRLNGVCVLRETVEGRLMTPRWTNTLTLFHVSLVADVRVSNSKWPNFWAKSEFHHKTGGWEKQSTLLFTVKKISCVCMICWNEHKDPHRGFWTWVGLSHTTSGTFHSATSCRKTIECETHISEAVWTVFSFSSFSVKDPSPVSPVCETSSSKCAVSLTGTGKHP